MSSDPEVTVTYTIHQDDWQWEVAEEDCGIVLRYYEWGGECRKEREMRREVSIPMSDAKAICDAIMALVERAGGGRWSDRLDAALAKERA